MSFSNAKYFANYILRPEIGLLGEGISIRCGKFQ
jgi:hypothetical protein